MIVKLADGSQYPLTLVRNTIRNDEEVELHTPSTFVFRFDGTGKNVTTLINELKEKFAVESNLKNMEVTTDSAKTPVIFNLGKVSDMLMVLNATATGVDVTFERE